MENKKQIKSKNRVSNFGEVNTNQRDVNAMLDLVYDETQRIDSRFLEPACGDGNFLIEVIKRKIALINKNYNKNQVDYERYLLIATGSLYGLDILIDNIESCKLRLFNTIYENYKRFFPTSFKLDYLKVLKFILNKNIINGDALTLLDLYKKPIVFSQWSLVSTTKVKRTDYTLTMLLAYQPMEGYNLFSDLGEKAFIPKPIKNFPSQHYLNLVDDDL